MCEAGRVGEGRQRHHSSKDSVGGLEARPGRDSPPQHPPLWILRAEGFLPGDERSQRGKMRMPARRQVLAQGWRDRKPSNAGEPGPGLCPSPPELLLLMQLPPWLASLHLMGTITVPELYH